jgi:hypothetical protein
MRPWLALAALCVALPARAGETTPTSTPTSTSTPTPTSTLNTTATSTATTEVSGAVASVDIWRHRLTVDTAGGVVELGWDRNTLIYQPGGATTAGALRPGAVLKAGLDPDRIAYWIQVRPPPAAAPAAAPVTPAVTPPATPAPPRRPGH